MALEIERKYLIKSDHWRESADDGVFISQGYVATLSGVTVRVRIYGEQGFITLKSSSNGGFSRSEYEYEVPLADAENMLRELCGCVIKKRRYRVLFDDKIWEVDIFDGDNLGLEVAEIELFTEDEIFNIPPWIGEEVTFDIRYGNGNLSKMPFKNWKHTNKY